MRPLMCVNVFTLCPHVRVLCHWVISWNMFGEGIYPLHEFKSILSICSESWRCIYLVISWCRCSICRCGIGSVTCLAAGVSGRAIWARCNYYIDWSYGGCWGVLDSYQSWETVRCLVVGTWYPLKFDIVSGKFQYLFTWSLAFLPFRNFCRGLWSLWTVMSDPCR